MSNNNKVTLGYWGIRGRGQIPRLLLAYTNAVWEDVQYNAPQQWFGGDKNKLGLSFPNLPYLIDGEVKITQTEAICHYIIDRSNRKELLGKTPQHKAVIMNINGVLNECFDNVVKILYVADGLKAKEAAYKDKFKPKLEYLEKFLGNNNWLLGYPTYADFVLVELSYYFEHIYPELFPQLKFLIRLRDNFSKLPEIQKYYEQQSSIKAPFTSMNFSNLKF